MAECWRALVKEEDGKQQTEDEPRGRDKKVINQQKAVGGNGPRCNVIKESWALRYLHSPKFWRAETSLHTIF
jgi:hypothetical protein